MKTPNFLTIDIHPDHDFYVQGKDKKMHYVEMKSDYVLSEFIRYCLENPSERFYQALTIFAGAYSIYLQNNGDAPNETNLIDAWFLETKNK